MGRFRTIATSGSDGSGGATIDVMANRPAASASQGKYYYVTDANPKLLFFSDGTDWVPVTTSPLMQSWDGATNTSTIPCTQGLTGYGTPPNADSCADSSHDGSWYGWHAFDGFLGATGWHSTPGGRLAYYFGVPRRVNKYRFYFDTSADSWYYPTSWTLEGPASGISNPNVSNNDHWTPLHQVATFGPSGTGWTDWFTFVVYEGITALRLRVIFASGSPFGVCEIQFIEDTRL